MARDFSAHHKEQNDKTTNQWGGYEISRAKKVHWGVPRKVNSSVNTFTSRQQNTTIRNIQQEKCRLQLLFPRCVERFSLDCRKTKTKVNTLANQRA